MSRSESSAGERISQHPGAVTGRARPRGKVSRGLPYQQRLSADRSCYGSGVTSIASCSTLIIAHQLASTSNLRLQPLESIRQQAENVLLNEGAGDVGVIDQVAPQERVKVGAEPCSVGEALT